MARTSNSKCDRCRRQGEKLFLKGERCYSPKCAFTRRNFAPGQHGATSRNRLSEYGQQLNEKQKARQTYDVHEKQFRSYFEKAVQSSGVTGEELIKSLETRLDNVVFRMQVTKSRRAARQLVRHGHVRVNGQSVDLPSFQVSKGDEVSLNEKAHKLTAIEENKKEIQEKLVPAWFDLDTKNLTAKVLEMPSARDASSEIGLQQIVEFYSR